MSCTPENIDLVKAFDISGDADLPVELTECCQPVNTAAMDKELKEKCCKIAEESKFAKEGVKLGYCSAP